MKTERFFWLKSLIKIFKMCQNKLLGQYPLFISLINILLDRDDYKKVYIRKV